MARMDAQERLAEAADRALTYTDTARSALLRCGASGSESEAEAEGYE